MHEIPHLACRSVWVWLALGLLLAAASACQGGAEPATNQGDSATERGKETVDDHERDASEEIGDRPEKDDDEGEQASQGDPYRLEVLETSYEGDSGRRLAWHAPEFELRIEIRFADAPHSRLDLLRDDQARRAALEASREAVSKRVIEAWVPIRDWIAKHLSDAEGGASLAEERPGLSLLLLEDPTAEPAAEGAHVLAFEQFAEPGVLEALLWREALPGLEPAIAYGLARLGPERATSEAAWLTRAYSWTWASQFGLSREDLFEVAVWLSGEEAVPAELGSMARWQFVDFVAYWLEEAGFAALLEQGASDWEAWQERWVADRREWAALHELGGEPHLEALWRLERGEVSEALAQLDWPLPAETLRTERRVVVHEGLGKLAFLAGDARFCRLWLTERLLNEAFTQVMIHPEATIPPARLVPIKDVPLVAVAATAFDDADSAERAVDVLLEAGRLELALLVRVTRGLIDGSPRDPSALERLERWAAASYGDQQLAEFIRAWAEAEANQMQAARERTRALPEPYASAWRARHGE